MPNPQAGGSTPRPAQRSSIALVPIHADLGFTGSHLKRLLEPAGRAGDGQGFCQRCLSRQPATPGRG